MAQYKVIVDLFSNLVELKEQALFADCHEVELEPTGPTITDHTLETYEEEAIGTTVGTVLSSTYVGVTFEIIAGNTGNAFTINSSTGVITTAAILDYETLSTYTLTVRVTLNGFSELTDTGSITINVLRMYHICADNGPWWSGTTVNNQVSYLEGKEIILLSGGTIGDYAINWNLNSVDGTTVFISGNEGNTDPDIQAYHPFYEPVQAGTLYAVVRYIEIDSVMYTGVRLSEDGQYSQDLRTCLGTRTVIALSCSNESVGDYGHTITYTNATMLPAAAERTVTYLLNEDGSTKQIAWRFYGYEIADRITISYVSGTNETVIEDWIVGSDNSGNNFTSSPKLLDVAVIASVFSLTGFTYTNGDSLKFQVSPSYNAPSNTDTNWQLSTKCFIEDVEFDSSYASGDITVIGDTGTTLTMSWNSTSCCYDVEVHTISGASNTDVYKYYQPRAFYGSSDFDTDSTLQLYFRSGSTYSWGTVGSQYLLDGQMNIARNSINNTLTYTFTQESDYLDYKTSYATLTGTSLYTGYSTDPQNPNHYALYYYSDRISLTSGDTYTQLSVRINRDASFSFDDVNYKITINLTAVSVTYTGETCNNYGSEVASRISEANNFYSGSTFSYDTIWGLSILRLVSYPLGISAETDKTFSAYLGVTSGIVSSTLPLGPRFVTLGAMSVFYKRSLRVIITNTSDPVNNYEVYSNLNSDGTINGSWTLIKKVGT